MSGRIVYEPPKPEPEPEPHECYTPSPYGHEVGTIWLCDDCNGFKILRNKRKKNRDNWTWDKLRPRELRSFDARRASMLKVTIERTHMDRDGQKGELAALHIADLDPTSLVSDHCWWITRGARGGDELHGEKQGYDKRQGWMPLIVTILEEISAHHDFT